MAFYWDILLAEFWLQRITLSSEFWKDRFHHCNGRGGQEAEPKIDVTLYSDASDTGRRVTAQILQEPKYRAVGQRQKVVRVLHGGNSGV